MIFQVRITKQAESEIETTYAWHRHRDAAYADRWFRGLMDKLATLQAQPKRCGLAPENEVFPEAVRQLLYGKRRSTYRVLFVVRGDVVFILHVRSSRRATLKAEDWVDNF